jgi:hypothetical protein
MKLRTMRRWMLLTASLALVAAGCERVDFAASLGPGGIVAGQSASSLVGRWFRVESGSGFGGTTTETSWEFAANGTAIRTITVRTPQGQTLETTKSQLGWSAGRGLLTLAFGPPTLHRLRVPYSISYGVDATVLFIQGVPYLRAS